MPILKHSVPGVAQGYAAGQLEKDLKTFAALHKVNDKGRVEYLSEEITETIVGKACQAVMPQVKASLEKLFYKKLLKLLSDEAVVWVNDPEETNEQVLSSEVQLKMGPLKKVSRIIQKAAHYAVCDDNSATLQIDKVRDILRATMVFPPAAWRTEGIGSKFIDAVNNHFGGAVVQVKNRFIETRYPNLKALDHYRLPQDLKNNIRWLFKQTLYGRDTFYRDMALLIRIDNDKFPNGQGMDHTILELQFASNLMYGAKTFKGQDNTNQSGHDMYKTVRAVMEHCEFLYWQDHWKMQKPSQDLRLPNPASYYDVTEAHLSQFPHAVKTMYGLYRSKEMRGLGVNLDRAIDNSNWYKQLASKRAA